MSSQQEELFEKLIEETASLGRKVTFNEFNRVENLPAQANSLAYYYGSFDKAAETAWREVNRRKAQTVRVESDRTEATEMSKSKSKQSQISSERKKQIINELVGIYIKRGGIMPTSRDIKKSPYITEAEVKALRASGDLTEPKIRGLAEAQTGKSFPSPEERRVQAIRKHYGCDTRVERQAKIQPAPEELAPEVKGSAVNRVAETDPRTSKSVRGRNPISREDAVADIRRLMAELGHMPSQKDIKNINNGARYSYPTYVKKLGPKSKWFKVLGLEEEEPN